MDVILIQDVNTLGGKNEVGISIDELVKREAKL